MSTPRVSIIIPVLNEGAHISERLKALSAMRQNGVEIIVVDGGSTDGTIAAARPHADHVFSAPRGRGAQMNAGARIASGGVLLFLHADTALPDEADRIVCQSLEQSARAWGRFDVSIDGAHPLLALIGAMMNIRSRLTGIATGDQAIFVTREVFLHVGLYPEIPLMEDIVLSRKLKRLSRPACVRARVRTSGRRWEENGVFRTLFLMWRLRLAFFMGRAPAALARRYGYVPRES